MKRFWTAATVVADGDGWGIELDGRRVRTPARAMLTVASRPLADAIAAEWDSVGERLDPRAMPLTGLANAAIDRVAPDPAEFAAALAKYAEGDLTCYRAEGPPKLIARQAEQWDALLAWARRRFDVDFVTTSGLLHVAQPAAAVERLAHAVAVLDAFRLAGLSPLVTLGGSLIAALAVLEGAVTPDQAWAAVSIDEAWQIEQWGDDAEAVAAMAGRRRDFLAAARFLELLD
ncbi:ATP12 family protein [Sphingomonas sp.]|uniref:ATP12 family chaperone protein n=1 Tax=Sphingomonas sp. TaxID=28214 RepID=UPI00286E4B16|nr:ATP12 family protein [Sphingomonas sp.]